MFLAVLLNSLTASSDKDLRLAFLSAAARLIVSEAKASASCGNLIVLYESKRWSSFCFSSQIKFMEGPVIKNTFFIQLQAFIRLCSTPST